jgi:hypothetical protein
MRRFIEFFTANIHNKNTRRSLRAERSFAVGVSSAGFHCETSTLIGFATARSSR